MGNLNRFTQVKELQVKYSRWDMENLIPDINFETIEKNGKIIEALERYVSDFITSDRFSLDYISELLTKLRLYKWIELEKDVSINKMLFSLIINTVILPDYLNNSNAEKNYSELKRIIDMYLENFDAMIEKLNTENYHLELWNPVSIIEEITQNAAQNDDSLDPRIFPIGKWFWNNVFEYEPNFDGFVFRIPIQITSKENKSKRKINLAKLRKFIDKKAVDYSQKNPENQFVISYDTEQDRDLIYWDNNLTSYFTIMLGKLWAYNSREAVLLFLKQLIEVNNYFINEISKEFGMEIQKNIHIFSSGDILHFWRKNKDGSWSQKFEQLKIKDSQKVTLNDVWWQEEAKKEIETIIKMIQHEDVIESWWAKHSKWIIFEGPTGTWKTLLARVVASAINAEVYNIKLTDIQTSAFINEWANNIKELFAFLKEKSKTTQKKIIVILDELDALFKKRSSGGNSSWEDVKIVNTFLSEMWWMDDIDNVIFIWTTNLIDTIDPAVIRSGRMSTKIKVELPNKSALQQIYEIHIWKLPEKSQKSFWSIDIEKLANLSEWLSWADVENIINRLVTLKAMQEIETKEISDITIEESKEIISKVRWVWKTRGIWFLNA